MLRSVMKNHIVDQVMIFFCLSTLLALPCYGGVIFEKSFDNDPDWNTNGQYNGECSYPCATAPTDWNATRMVPGTGFTTPTGRISALPSNTPDHTGTALGKAFVIYNESDDTQNWPGDSMLVKVLPSDYNELYFRAWVRTQPGWQWAQGVSGSKMVRFMHYDKTNPATFQFFSGGASAPIYIWDFYYSTVYGVRLSNSYRCSPQSSDYYCPNSPGTDGGQAPDNSLFPGTDYPPAWTPTTTGAYADGSWHKLDVHVKLNSAPGANDGIMQFWWDVADPINAVPVTTTNPATGVYQYIYSQGASYARTNVQWMSSTSDTSRGWNTFALGGNSNNSFTTGGIKGEQWYAIDDVVVSTTPIPANYVIGGVIFETNFDSNADWNTTGQYEGNECSPLGVGAPSMYTCASNTYPQNWSGYRSVPGTTGLNPVVSISRPPDNIDHTTGTGKAAIIRSESVNGVNWPGDGILQKYLGAEYPELYLQFWFRSQSGWQFDPSSVDFLKLFRVSRKYNLASNWFDEFTQGIRPVPQTIIQPKMDPTYGWRHQDPMRGYPDDNASPYPGTWKGVCTDTSIWNGRTVCRYDTEGIEDPFAYDVANGGGPIPGITFNTPGQLFDGSWHKVVYHIKMNDVGTANGILQMWIDGVQKTNATQLTWIGATGSPVGWNQFLIGGNSNNTFNSSTPSDQWYAIDDVVVSTTPIPANYVIGGSSDTQAPTIPANLTATAFSSAQINLSWTASSDNVGVTGYKIYCNGTYVTTISSGTTYSDTGLTPSTQYTYAVSAVDAVGNESGLSTSVNATTQTGPITIGETNVLSIDDSNNGNLLVAQLTTLSQTATIQSLSFYVTQASGKLRLGIYDATGPNGGPGAMKAETNEITPTVGWNSANVVTPASLSPGMYWLAYLPNDNTLHMRRSGTGSYVQYDYVYGALPATYSTAPTTGNDHWSFYAALSTDSADTTPPAVSITAPANNVIVSGTVTVTANALDNVGVSKVEYYVNGTLQATGTVSPYSFDWHTTSVTNGSYTLTATAYDVAGNAGQSSPVSVTVNNPNIEITLSTSVIAADYKGTVGITISGISPEGGEILVEQFVDANKNGIVDAGDYVIRSFSISDGLASQNLNIPGDEDGTADGSVTTSLNYFLISDLYHAPGNYIFRVTRGTNVAEAPFTVAPVSGAQSISGIVTDGTNVVSGAVVRLLDKWQRTIAFTITDTSGQYTLNVKQPGDYYVTPAAYGYATSTTNVTLVTLATGQNIVSNNLTLTSGTNHVTGRLKDDTNGAGIAGIWVEAGGSDFQSVAITNSNGEYDLLMPLGTYTVAVSADISVPALFAKGYVVYKNQSVSVDLSTDISGQDIALPKGAFLVSGRVLDQAGYGVPGLPVQGRLSGSVDPLEPVALGVTDESGNYTLSISSGDSWSLFLGDANGQTGGYLGGVIRGISTASASLSGNDIAFNPTTAWIKGTVRDSSNRVIAGVEMQLRNADSSQVATIKTAADGTYRLATYAGDWLVKAFTENIGLYPVSEENVAVADGQTATVDFTADVSSYNQLGITAACPLLSVLGSSFDKNLYGYWGANWAYTWSISAGGLPPGVSLNSGGRISGIPIQAGTYAFNLLLTDSWSGLTASKFCSFIVDSVGVGTAFLNSWTVGENYSQTLNVVGGNGPYTWGIAGGSLPGGLALDVATGIISGTPTVTGMYPVRFRVIDITGASASRVLVVAVTDLSEQWVRTYDGFDGTLWDGATGLVVDNNGNVYVTGVAYTADGFYIATIKYDAAGNVAWVRRYDLGLGNGIALDSGGNVIVTGGTWDGNTVTIKYAPDGSVIWSNTYVGGSGEKVAVDSADNVYVAWNDGTNTIVIKYDSTGNLADSYVLGSGWSWIDGIAVDGTGNIYMTRTDTNSTNDIVTLKSDANGQVLWQMKYDGGDNDDAYDLAIDRQGGVYVTGRTYVSLGSDNSDVLLIKYDGVTGVQQWLKTYGGPDYDRGGGVAVDVNGNVYVSGRQRFDDGHDGALLLKYTAEGGLLWSKSYDNGVANGAVIDSMGNFYLTGWIDTVNNGDYLTIKYQPVGQ